MTIIDIQPTPNPNALKFIVDVNFPTGSHSFMSAKDAEKDLLAKEIFALGKVVSVFYMNNFLTVSKTPDGDWATLKEGIMSAVAKG
jgi:NFU1 iron-sulfur cluster scaffold homolog, mitochondrial